MKSSSLIYSLVVALVPVVIGSADYPAGSLPPLKIIVGGYHANINLLEYNPTTQNFKNVSISPINSTGANPSFITFSPDGRYFFAVNEVSDFRGLNQTGSVTSFEFHGESNKIRPISTGLTGADPVSVAVSPDGKSLITAEYTGGSWSRFSLNHRGEFKSPKPVQVWKYHGSGPVKKQQDQSYLHQVVINRAGDLVFFVDLGGDSVYIHRVDQLTGHVADLAHEIKVPPGTGPIHLSLVEKGKEYDIYLISEVTNEMFNIRLTDHGGLKSVIRQKLSTLPRGVTDASTFAAGEVMVSRDERFVYGANRQTDTSKPLTDNSIVKFTRDLHTGLLIEHSAAWFPITIGGNTPRQFSFSKDYEQSFVVVGCLQSNTLLIFSRNPHDGHLILLSTTTVVAPAVQLFLPEPHIHS